MCSEKSSVKIRVSMFTPWDQVCGNAEYAKRLVPGLEGFASVEIHEMRNISDRYDEDGKYLTRSALNSYFRGLASAAKNSVCDVVHIQHEFGFFGSSFGEADKRFLTLVRGIRKPLVVTLHTFVPSMSRRPFARRSQKVLEIFLHWWRTRHIREALRRADAIVLHSGYTQRLLLRAFPEIKKKIRVIPIAIEALPPGSSVHWTKGGEEKWVIVPGFVSAYKGHDYALRAMELLPENYKLVVAGGLHPKDPGSSEMWMQLLAKMDELGLRKRVVFTGFIENPAEQAALFEQADAFLLPYHEVGQSGSAALADVLAYGRPVITSWAKSMFVYRMESDMVNACISVDVGKPGALADAIRGGIENTQGLHNPAHQRSACLRYNLQKTTSAYEQMFRETINRGRDDA
jgi:glycosyltransferase involved in cell wall biosynthesis